MEEVRARQQWELTVANQLQKQKLSEALALQQQQEEIAKLEANPSRKNNQKLQSLKQRIAKGEALEAACQKLESDADRLKDEFVRVLVVCSDVTAMQILDDQIEGRDKLKADYLALSSVLNAHKAAADSFAYKDLKILFDRLMRAWAYLEQQINSKVEAEKEAFRKAREKAREAEWDAEFQKAQQRERDKGKTGGKSAPKELAKLVVPAALVGASPAALAIYTWAYGHAMDANHTNWRTAYQDPLNRPLGPSYPATETITFPAGVRNIVPSHARQFVTLAVALEVGRLWARQALEVPGGALGTTKYLTGTTEPHGSHINLVLEGGNVSSSASVLNLHVFFN